MFFKDFTNNTLHIWELSVMIPLIRSGLIFFTGFLAILLLFQWNYLILFCCGVNVFSVPYLPPSPNITNFGIAIPTCLSRFLFPLRLPFSTLRFLTIFYIFAYLPSSAVPFFFSFSCDSPSLYIFILLPRKTLSFTEWWLQWLPLTVHIYPDTQEDTVIYRWFQWLLKLYVNYLSPFSTVNLFISVTELTLDLLFLPIITD